MLPESGSVLGIDVGFSPKKRTTAFCCLSWDRERLESKHACATADYELRHQALGDVLSGRSEVMAVAIDGPLRPSLPVVREYRTAECVLSRGAFQKRGKPGQTHAGSGPKLHDHATQLARLVPEHGCSPATTMPFSIVGHGIYEAFPNLFLGVLCDETKYPVRPEKGRCWTDSLFYLVRGRLEELLRYVLPGRAGTNATDVKGYEPIAALVCALTALSAAAGVSVAVGAARDGFIVLPPLVLWGSSASGERWAERELRKNVHGLKQKPGGLSAPEIYVGLDLWDLEFREARG